MTSKSGGPRQLGVRPRLGYVIHTRLSIWDGYAFVACKLSHILIYIDLSYLLYSTMLHDWLRAISEYEKPSIDMETIEKAWADEKKAIAVVDYEGNPRKVNTSSRRRHASTRGSQSPMQKLMMRASVCLRRRHASPRESQSPTQRLMMRASVCLGIYI